LRIIDLDEVELFLEEDPLKEGFEDPLVPNNSSMSFCKSKSSLLVLFCEIDGEERGEEDEDETVSEVVGFTERDGVDCGRPTGRGFEKGTVGEREEASSCTIAGFLGSGSSIWFCSEEEEEEEEEERSSEEEDLAF